MFVEDDVHRTLAHGTRIRSSDATLCRDVIAMLRHPCPFLCKKALQVICDTIAENDDGMTQNAIDQGVLPVLMELLVPTAPTETLGMLVLTISNIAAGTAQQLDALLATKQLPATLHEIMDHCVDPYIRMNVAYAILNILKYGNDMQRARFAAHGLMKTLAIAFDDPCVYKTPVIKAMKLLMSLATV